MVYSNPGRFAPITCLPWVDSPRKVSRFAPLNRYYIIIDEIFFDNFLVIIYLLVVCKKNNNSFILVYFNYLFISCIQKKIIHSFWSTLIIYFLVVYKKKSFIHFGNDVMYSLFLIPFGIRSQSCFLILPASVYCCTCKYQKTGQGP
jgi:hypothetical protein